MKYQVFQVLTFVLFFAVTSLTLGSITRTGRRMPTFDPDIRRIPMDLIEMDKGLCGRTLVVLPRGECVVSRPPLVFVSMPELLTSIPATKDSRGYPLHWVSDPIGSDFYIAEDDLSSITTFNCGTYAIGSVIGLTKSDWLSTTPLVKGDPVSPAETVLQCYFTELGSIDVAKPGPVETAGLDIKDGDIVAFHSDHESGSMVHIGKCSLTRGGLMVRSKLGDGPLVQGSIEATVNAYPETVLIRVYRIRSDGPSGR